MPTQEIPRDQWVEFFDSFSRRHQGWLVTLEVLAADVGDQFGARELPLEGITAELGDFGEDQIDVFVGATPGSHLAHKITAPRCVHLKRTEEGADEALEICGEDVTLIRFRSAVPTELVDGIL